MNAEPARGLLGGADEVGQFVADNLASFVACNAADPACFADFARDFTTRAWRTPPSAAVQEAAGRLARSRDGVSVHAAADRRQAEQVASLLDRLKSKAAGAGTLLDHTLVVWGNEIGFGGAQEHGGERLPMILAGSLGGRIRTNQLIKLDNILPC